VDGYISRERAPGAGWAKESVWTLGRKEKLLGAAWNGNMSFAVPPVV